MVWERTHPSGESCTRLSSNDLVIKFKLSQMKIQIFSLGYCSGPNAFPLKWSTAAASNHN